MSAIGKSHGSWTHAAVAALPSTTRARRALYRAASFGSLLAFLLIDFSRYFFDQGDS
jgi:phosphodiesterase/alkaline phosphatase D-like protein